MELVKAEAPDLPSLQPPRTLEEARRLAELGACLCLAAAESKHSGIGPREENLLRTGLAAAILKLGGQGKGGSE